MGNIIVAIIVFGGLSAIIARLIVNKRRGKRSCCDCCSGCAAGRGCTSGA